MNRLIVIGLVLTVLGAAGLAVQLFATGSGDALTPVPAPAEESATPSGSGGLEGTVGEALEAARDGAGEMLGEAAEAVGEAVGDALEGAGVASLDGDAPASQVSEEVGRGVLWFVSQAVLAAGVLLLILGLMARPAEAPKGRKK